MVAVVLLASVTVTTTPYGLPATAVGMPETAPDAELIVNPGGRLVAVQT
jgi:hypothetical protein